MKRQARIVGLFYLAVIVGGLFAEGVVRGSLIVPDDAVATANEIAGSQTLWRWGLAVHLVYLLAAIVVNVLLSGLFSSVQATLARLALVFGVASVTIEAMSLLQLYVPLAMMDERGTLTALQEQQRQALAYLAVRLFPAGFGVALVFFSAFCALIGVLILRSRLVPRVLGALMVLAGGCYFVNSLALILSPAVSDAIFPAILAPCLVGELSLVVWLVVKGVDDGDVAAAARSRCPPV